MIGHLGDEPRMRRVAALALSVVIGTPAIAQQQAPPAGRLTAFAGNEQAANFIDEESVRREGHRVSLSTFRVYAAPIASPAGPIVYDTTALVIDCAARTFERRHVDAFTASGRYATSMGAEPAQAIEANQTWDFAAKVVCDGVSFGQEATVSGYQAAHDLAMRLIRPS
jgi:hypothetical protein